MDNLKEPTQLSHKAQEVIETAIEYILVQGATLPDNIQASICDYAPLQKAVEDALKGEVTEEKINQYEQQLQDATVTTKAMHTLKNAFSLITFCEKPEDRFSNRIVLTLLQALSPLNPPTILAQETYEKLLDVVLPQIDALQLLCPLKYPEGYIAITQSIKNSMINCMNAEVFCRSAILETIWAIDFMTTVEFVPLLMQGVQKYKALEKTQYIMQLQARILKDEELMWLANEKPFVVSKIFSSKALNTMRENEFISYAKKELAANATSNPTTSFTALLISAGYF